jgi:hypothetical protein
MGVSLLSDADIINAAKTVESSPDIDFSKSVLTAKRIFMGAENSGLSILIHGWKT